MFYYRATDYRNIPPYKEYDFSRGIAAYTIKLPSKVANDCGMYLLGEWTEKQYSDYLSGKNRSLAKKQWERGIKNEQPIKSWRP